jgi:hydroxymethylglutaryl-CoA reductase (NADPH)
MVELVPRFTGQGYSADAVERRRRWVEEKTGVELRHVGSHSISGDAMRGNIENPIGVAQVPLGVVGPLRVRGEHARGVFYVPMATTEGALLRSYERGMAAITRAGGATARVLVDENRVSPVFPFAAVEEAAAFLAALPGRFAELRARAESTTRHGRLLRLQPRLLGRDVIVDFCYHTADAHGMNMIVHATDVACRFLVEQGAAPRYYIFSGYDSEKRAAGSLLQGGKGKTAVAGVRLPAALLRALFRVDAERMLDLWQRTVAGHLQAAALGFNAHYANGLAAIFIACGQDVANLANAAVGITRVEPAGGGDLYVSVTLPALTVATVGGGTGLGSFRECLAMLGCEGVGTAVRLAEIVAAAILAGEISFAAAIAAGELAQAHEAYGRNRPGGPEGPQGPDELEEPSG